MKGGCGRRTREGACAAGCVFLATWCVAVAEHARAPPHALLHVRGGGSHLVDCGRGTGGALSLLSPWDSSVPRCEDGGEVADGRREPIQACQDRWRTGEAEFGWGWLWGQGIR